MHYLIQKQNNNNPIEKIYLYPKDLSEPKYQFLINRAQEHENAGVKNYNNPTAFIEYSNTMDDVFSNIDDCNPKRKRKILIVFDDMISDIMTNKRSNKAQYELDREAAKISALSSGELEKYEYLTNEDLGYKPDVILKAKFEYSPLGKVFNKGLDE